MEGLTQSKFDSEEYAFKDMKLVLGGRPVAGFRAVKFKIATVQEALHASGDDPWSVQSGNTTYTGEIRLLQSECEALIEAAKALGKSSPTKLTLTAIVNFSREVTEPMKTHEIKNFKFEEFEMGMEQGDTFMEVTFPFVAQKINLDI